MRSTTSRTCTPKAHESQQGPAQTQTILHVGLIHRNLWAGSFLPPLTTLSWPSEMREPNPKPKSNQKQSIYHTLIDSVCVCLSVCVRASVYRDIIFFKQMLSNISFRQCCTKGTTRFAMYVRSYRMSPPPRPGQHPPTGPSHTHTHVVNIDSLCKLSGTFSFLKYLSIRNRPRLDVCAS